MLDARCSFTVVPNPFHFHMLFVFVGRVAVRPAHLLTICLHILNPLSNASGLPKAHTNASQNHQNTPFAIDFRRLLRQIIMA